MIPATQPLGVSLLPLDGLSYQLPMKRGEQTTAIDTLINLIQEKKISEATKLFEQKQPLEDTNEFTNSPRLNDLFLAALNENISIITSTLYPYFNFDSWDITKNETQAILNFCIDKESPSENSDSKEQFLDFIKRIHENSPSWWEELCADNSFFKEERALKIINLLFECKIDATAIQFLLKIDFASAKAECTTFSQLFCHVGFYIVKHKEYAEELQLLLTTLYPHVDPTYQDFANASSDDHPTTPFTVAILCKRKEIIEHFISKNIDLTHEVEVDGILKTYFGLIFENLGPAYCTTCIKAIDITKKETFNILSQLIFLNEANHLNEPVALCLVDAICTENPSWWQIPEIKGKLFELAAEYESKQVALRLAPLIDVGTTENSKRSYTISAAANGWSDIVALFIQKGANLALSREGKTAYEWIIDFCENDGSLIQKVLHVCPIEDLRSFSTVVDALQSKNFEKAKSALQKELTKNKPASWTTDPKKFSRIYEIAALNGAKQITTLVQNRMHISAGAIIAALENNWVITASEFIEIFKKNNYPLELPLKNLCLLIEQCKNSDAIASLIEILPVEPESLIFDLCATLVDAAIAKPSETRHAKALSIACERIFNSNATCTFFQFSDDDSLLKIINYLYQEQFSWWQHQTTNFLSWAIQQNNSDVANTILSKGSIDPTALSDLICEAAKASMDETVLLLMRQGAPLIRIADSKNSALNLIIDNSSQKFVHNLCWEWFKKHTPLSFPESCLILTTLFDKDCFLIGKELFWYAHDLYPRPLWLTTKSPELSQLFCDVCNGSLDLAQQKQIATVLCDYVDPNFKDNHIADEEKLVSYAIDNGWEELILAWCKHAPIELLMKSDILSGIYTNKNLSRKCIEDILCIYKIDLSSSETFAQNETKQALAYFLKNAPIPLLKDLFFENSLYFLVIEIIEKLAIEDPSVFDIFCTLLADLLRHNDYDKAEVIYSTLISKTQNSKELSTFHKTKVLEAILPYKQWQLRIIELAAQGVALYHDNTGRLLQKIETLYGEKFTLEVLQAVTLEEEDMTRALLYQTILSKKTTYTDLLFARITNPTTGPQWAKTTNGATNLFFTIIIFDGAKALQLVDTIDPKQTTSPAYGSHTPLTMACCTSQEEPWLTIVKKLLPRSDLTHICARGESAFYYLHTQYPTLAKNVIETIDLDADIPALFETLTRENFIEYIQLLWQRVLNHTSLTTFIKTIPITNATTPFLLHSLLTNNRYTEAELLYNRMAEEFAKSPAHDTPTQTKAQTLEVVVEHPIWQNKIAPLVSYGADLSYISQNSSSLLSQIENTFGTNFTLSLIKQCPIEDRKQSLALIKSIETRKSFSEVLFKRLCTQWHNNRQNLTALFFAVASSTGSSMALRLVDDIDPEQESETKMTPLMVACSYIIEPWPSIVAMLLPRSELTHIDAMGRSAFSHLYQWNQQLAQDYLATCPLNEETVLLFEIMSREGFRVTATYDLWPRIQAHSILPSFLNSIAIDNPSIIPILSHLLQAKQYDKAEILHNRLAKRFATESVPINEKITLLQALVLFPEWKNKFLALIPSPLPLNDCKSMKALFDLSLQSDATLAELLYTQICATSWSHLPQHATPLFFSLLLHGKTAWALKFVDCIDVHATCTNAENKTALMLVCEQPKTNTTLSLLRRILAKKPSLTAIDASQLSAFSYLHKTHQEIAIECIKAAVHAPNCAPIFDLLVQEKHSELAITFFDTLALSPNLSQFLETVSIENSVISITVLWFLLKLKKQSYAELFFKRIEKGQNFLRFLKAVPAEDKNTLFVLDMLYGKAEYSALYARIIETLSKNGKEKDTPTSFKAQLTTTLLQHPQEKEHILELISLGTDLAYKGEGTLSLIQKIEETFGADFTLQALSKTPILDWHQTLALLQDLIIRNKRELYQTLFNRLIDKDTAHSWIRHSLFISQLFCTVALNKESDLTMRLIDIVDVTQQCSIFSVSAGILTLTPLMMVSTISNASPWRNCVEKLLIRGASITTTNNLGKSAFTYIHHMFPHIATRLITEVSLEQDQSALFSILIQNKHDDLFQQLFSRLQSMQPTPRWWSPYARAELFFQLAPYAKQYPIFNEIAEILLLDPKIALSTKNQSEQSILMVALEYKFPTQSIQTLLERTDDKELLKYDNNHKSAFSYCIFMQKALSLDHPVLKNFFKRIACNPTDYTSLEEYARSDRTTDSVQNRTMRALLFNDKKCLETIFSTLSFAEKYALIEKITSQEHLTDLYQDRLLNVAFTINESHYAISIPDADLTHPTATLEDLISLHTRYRQCPTEELSIQLFINKIKEQYTLAAPSSVGERAAFYKKIESHILFVLDYFKNEISKLHTLYGENWAATASKNPAVRQLVTEIRSYLQETVIVSNYCGIRIQEHARSYYTKYILKQSYDFKSRLLYDLADYRTIIVQQGLPAHEQSVHAFTGFLRQYAHLGLPGTLEAQKDSYANGHEQEIEHAYFHFTKTYTPANVINFIRTVLTDSNYYTLFNEFLEKLRSEEAFQIENYIHSLLCSKATEILAAATKTEKEKKEALETLVTEPWNFECDDSDLKDIAALKRALQKQENRNRLFFAISKEYSDKTATLFRYTWVCIALVLKDMHILT